MWTRFATSFYFQHKNKVHVQVFDYGATGDFNLTSKASKDTKEMIGHWLIPKWTKSDGEKSNLTHQVSHVPLQLELEDETEVEPFHLNSKPSLLTDNSHYNLKWWKNRGDEGKDD